MSAETDVLVAVLDSQRRHVLGILEGLGEDDLRRPVLPSGWSALALVRHLTLDVEQFWFRRIVAGEQVPDAETLPPDAEAWDLPDDLDADRVLADYRREAALADDVLRATTPEAAPAAWPEGLFPPSFRLETVREVVLHALGETACHAGHLDAVRELLDGRQWMVLTG